MSAIIIEHDLVHYEAVGRGHPIVFIHGWVGSWRYWWSAMQMVAAAQYRAYAFDLWGYGDSGKRRERYDFESYVNLLGDFTEQLGLPSATLVGHSLGAAVALRYACEQPEWVERVMTVTLPVPDQLGMTASTFLSRLTGRRSDVGYPEVDSEVPKADEVALATSTQTLLEMDLASDLRECPKPHLLVYGAKDPFISPLNDGWVSSLNSTSSVRQVNLDQSRHFPMLDETSKFTRLLLDFIDAGKDLENIEIKDQWRRRTR